MTAPGSEYDPPSHLEIPGLEAILQYGDSSQMVGDWIPGAMKINDHSRLDRARITNMDGLHDDPESAETRQANSDRYGERAGNLVYRGRTIGLTGRVEAGNIGAMRSNWRRLRGQFGTEERDLVVHHPFEVPKLVNGVMNPNLDIDADTWGIFQIPANGTPSLLGGVTDGLLKVGSAGIASATTSGTLHVHGPVWQTALPPQKWSGEDVWVTGRMKAYSATGGSVSSLAVSVVQYIGGAIFFSVGTVASVVGPSTGSWYKVANRVPASLISPAAEYVGVMCLMNYTAAGSYTMHFHRTACVLLAPDEPTPVSYFGEDVPGFSAAGSPRRSFSFGPSYAKNVIADPRLEQTDVVSGVHVLTKWAHLASGGSVTVNQAPMLSSAFAGDHVPRAAYYKATTGSTTPTTFGVVALAEDGSNYFLAVEGRRYRLTLKVKPLTKPATGTLAASIVWLDQVGNEISSSSSDPLVVGVNDAVVEATAPAGAVLARATVRATGVTTSGAVLEVLVSDPCHVDVTDWDPGAFYGLGDSAEETDRYRRIPRPFLLKSVRKSPGEMKAPEQQSRSRAWRDFSMSLRASDPLVYAIDERSRFAQMVGEPQFVSESMAPLVSYDGVVSTNPTGFTEEGTSGLTGWHYGIQSLFTATSMLSVGNRADLSRAQPAAQAIWRARRTLEGYTYQRPRVVVQGHVQMKKTPSLPPFVIGTDGAGSYSYNSVGALLKRVSSSQWLQVYINSSSHAGMAPFGSAWATAPYSVELWSSHNAAGSAAVTRLAQWDTNTINAMADPLKYPMELQLVLDDFGSGDAVQVKLISTDVNGVRYEEISSTYTLPSPLVTLFGVGVAGEVGAYIRSSRWTNSLSGSTWPTTPNAYGFPWISYFEASRADVDPTPPIECQVIGDAGEIPQRIVLRGDIDSPVITVIRPDGQQSTIRLNGVAAESNPVTVDVGRGTIEDSNGENLYSMLTAGSLSRFAPGVNKVLVQARDWGDYPQHVEVRWQDALS